MKPKSETASKMQPHCAAWKKSKRAFSASTIEALRPVDYDDLQQAADLIQNFNLCWNEREKLADPADGRKQLIAQIVDREFVYENEIIAIVLHGDFAILLGKIKWHPSKSRMPFNRL